MDINTEYENYYTVGDAKVYFDSDGKTCMLSGVEGVIDDFVLPDTINGMEVDSMDCDYMREDGKFKKIIVSENNKYFLLKDNVLFSRDGKILYLFNNYDIKIYRIPSGVEEIDASAFCSFKLKNIAIPEGVRRIYQYAFACCREVEKIYIPSTVEMISLKTFYFFGRESLQVYYGGTPEQWGKIDFAFGNAELKNAEIHYNCTDYELF